MAWPPRLAAAKQSAEARLLSLPLLQRPPPSPRSRSLLVVVATELVWPNAVAVALATNVLEMDAE